MTVLPSGRDSNQANCEPVKLAITVAVTCYFFKGFLKPSAIEVVLKSNNFLRFC